MKEFAALGAGIVIAAVAALWFTTRPVLVKQEIRPLQASAEVSTFRPLSPNSQNE
ncbi:hypothetical protein [Bradyrhizobium sp. AS23.2]|uniref:hypothetical protein n=1 Tax=Bradyrhizobium sp. AS23.2 TaxID=1680155 RepID=UPI00142F45FE|nr:hypothetical protein [Bradyrhizobium sp. AS23.2]